MGGDVLGGKIPFEEKTFLITLIVIVVYGIVFLRTFLYVPPEQAALIAGALGFWQELVKAAVYLYIGGVAVPSAFVRVLERARAEKAP